MSPRMEDQFETLGVLMILLHYWPRLWPKRSENLKVTCSENPPRIFHAVWMRYE